MTQFEEFALYEFQSIEDAPFRPEQYSRMKFGCDEAAREMGHQIADAFFEKNASAILNRPCLMISSPFNFVPNAANVMTMHLLNRLNSHIVDAKGNHVEYATVPRKTSYVNDFGHLSGEERKLLLAGDRFYFNSQHFEGRCLLFVDDVKITGTHKNKLVELMHEQQLKNKTFFLYFARYTGDRPNIESEINFAAVKSIKDLNRIVVEPNHHMTARKIKYILSAAPSELYHDFLRFRSYRYLRALYFNCLNEGYYKIKEYETNIALIRNVIVYNENANSVQL
ncbi:phosphoribosyltransferase family protein (plasmid) [Rhizobium leguminosarum]|uniref:phosphoribosyltransferase family protein n=1 Tax=Rhizobium leguminosarum TaxID=384 RepID=UPI0024B223DA|nr:phosphoribosyltransferase family protein [Rhizobium leguminosarum]UIK01169.1 phosphoribosyltransferase family protein [Rhizobium leguminosarum]WFT90855.1 phosphoribosyltransferase family protein [Rhizobium leguminosarum]